MPESFISGQWRTLRRGEVYIASAWRRLTRAEAYIGGQWRTIATFIVPLSASVSPADANGYANPFKPIAQTITTNSVTITPIGGLGPFTYLWNKGNTPAMASNSFTRNVPANSDYFDTATWLVTDSLGNTASGAIDITFSNQSQT